MIVIDASAVVDLLLNFAPRSQAVRKEIARSAPDIFSPHLLDAEVTSVLRRYVLRKELSMKEAERALDELDALPIQRIPHQKLLRRVLQLRENVSAYDGIYVALAEALGAALITSDVALASIPGTRVLVRLTS